jgi:hypothetical protein
MYVGVRPERILGKPQDWVGLKGATWRVYLYLVVVLVSCSYFLLLRSRKFLQYRMAVWSWEGTFSVFVAEVTK